EGLSALLHPFTARAPARSRALTRVSVLSFLLSLFLSFILERKFCEAASQFFPGSMEFFSTLPGKFFPLPEIFSGFQGKFFPVFTENFSLYGNSVPYLFQKKPLRSERP
ncbi:MAG: hypothetical protein J5830_02365, partial [Clostridia bacterium]|nr:hypothetical protein [Clostridia bacterium]